MEENRPMQYAEKLAKMIQCKTVSAYNETDLTRFYSFHEVLKELFPNVFSVSEFYDFKGSILLKWKGKNDGKPILFMNHFDVVDGGEGWSREPFGGEIADGKIWGRGTVDTKSGLFSMLQAAEELISDGFVPEKDIYFESACTEECDGAGAEAISQYLKDNGIRFEYSLDEGGLIVKDPVGSSDNMFAMIGTGEKGCADIKFIARSNGGHASMPGKNTPIARLAKFVSDVERSNIFTVYLSPVALEMLTRIGGKNKGAFGFALRHAKGLKVLFRFIMPRTSAAASAMTRTTLAFTMMKGSDETNVLPSEAWVMGNMRFSHHQGQKGSFEAVKKIADKYDIEMVVTDPGIESFISDYRCAAFEKIERAVTENFTDVTPSPYVANSASDNRFMSKVCDACFGFAPFPVNDQQFDSIHGTDENIDIDTLPHAVDFYKYLMKNQ